MKDYYEVQMKMTLLDSEVREVKKVLIRYSYLTHYIETHNDEKVGAYENELDELEEKYPIDDYSGQLAHALKRVQRMGSAV